MKILAILLLSLLSAIPAFSAQIPEKAEVLVFDDFSGGLNKTVAENKLNRNYSPNVLNVFIDEEPGRLKKVGGFQVIGATNTLDYVSTLVKFRESGGQSTYIVSDSSTVLETVDFMSFTNLRSGLNQTALISCTQVLDDMWCTNGVQSVWTWSGTTVTILDGQTYSGTKTPDVPKGQHILFADERVWLFNTDSDDSAVHYSALSSTDGVAINPDDYRAWPETNSLNISEGDGYTGTAIWNFRGRVHVGKQNGIWVLFGSDEDTYNFRKIVSHIGPDSNDSVKVLDNQTYFKANGGFYKFDGSSVYNISDGFASDFENIESNETSVQSLSWDTKIEFDAGTMENLKSDSDGFVRLDTTTVVISTPCAGIEGCVEELNWSGTPNLLLYNINSATSTHFFSIPNSIMFTTFTSNFVGYVSSFTFALCASGGSGGGPFILSLRNARSGNQQDWGFFQESPNPVFSREAGFCPGDEQEGTPLVNSPSGGDIRGISGTYFSDKYATFTVTGSDLANGDLQARLEFPGSVGVTYKVYFPTATGGGNGAIRVIAVTTGTYTSEIATASAITAWESFRAGYNSNSGNVHFSIRTGTSVAKIVTTAFSDIASGSPINYPSTHTFFQWSSTMTSPTQGGVFNSIIPELDYVAADYNQGGSNLDRTISEVWKNRWWVFVSTELGSTSKVGYVKSKSINSNPDAFTNLHGINIRSLLNSDEFFYAGSSTAGVFMRLDSGTNFNGKTIVGIYEFPETVMANPFFKKEVLRYHIDSQQQTGATIKILTSVDGGDFTTSSTTISGVGRTTKTINNVQTNGYSFKWRILNDDLDKDLRLNSFGVIYMQTQRSD